MLKMSDNKRFDGWEEVDCNECSNYWDNSCDGIPPEGSRKPCNSFLAKRSVTIPLEIKSLKKRLTITETMIVLMNVLILLHLIFHM